VDYVLCEPPCHMKDGVVGVSPINRCHFGDKIDRNLFPEVSEFDPTENPGNVLDDVFARTGSDHKNLMRSIMERIQMGWVYGWVNPNIWDSLVDFLAQHDQK
jgi:hypothetical protein